MRQRFTRSVMMSAMMSTLWFCASTTPAVGQLLDSANSAGFIVRQGADTVTIERSSRSAQTLHAEMLGVRANRTRFAIIAEIGPSALVSRLVLHAWASGAPISSAPSQSGVMTFRGDSIIAETRKANGVSTDRIGTEVGVLPYYNVVVSLLEQIVRRARVKREVQAQIPVFILSSGGKTVGATVTEVGADSVLLELAGTKLRLRVDSVGRVLGGGDPSRGLVIERVPAAIVGRLFVSGATHAAPAGAPYVAEDVTVHSPDGPLLAGTFTHPKTPARTLAVVLISGSSAHDRDYTGPRGYRLFWRLADTLSRRGIAVLRLDNRGVGESTGDHDSATTSNRSEDVRAAVAFLRARSDVDGTRIGLIGISEGGLIAPIIASSDSLLRGIVLLAAPGESGRGIAVYQDGFRIARDSTIQLAQRDAALKAALHAADSLSSQRPWLREILDYDPIATARRVSATPILILQGDADQSVPPRDAQLLAAAFRAGGNHDVSVHMFPGVDHIFVRDSVGDVTKYASFPSVRAVPEVIGLITEWTVQHLDARVH